MKSKIRFLSLNIGMKGNLAGLTTMMIEYKLDIIFLQEVKLTDEELSSKVERLGYKCTVNINKDDISKPGTAIVWRSTLAIREVNSLVTCRAQLALLDGYVLLNLYAPSGSDKKYERGAFFSQELFRAFNLYPDAEWLVGGDFNCVLHRSDVENGTGFDQKKCPQLTDLVSIRRIQDVFRYKYPRCKEYTFFRTSAAPSRLDRFYIPESLLIDVLQVKHIASLSDHCGVFMEVTLNIGEAAKPEKIGRETYWKLNNSILKDDEFLGNFTDLWCWLKSLQGSYSDIADWWDNAAKPSFKDFCILFSKRRSNRRKDSKKFWFAYLKIVLEYKNWEEVSRIKEKLSNMLQEDASGYIIRSRFKNNASNEVASLYHANKEMKNSKSNSLNKLKIKGEVVSDPKAIEEEVVKFFNALFNGHHDTNLVDTGAPFIPNYLVS